MSLIPVSGQVQMDGKPLPDVVVTLLPEEKDGEKLWALTDEDGHFELQHKDRPGGIPGKYKVMLTTSVEPDDEDPAKVENFKEPIPPQFNTQTTLMAEVKEDEELSFNLKTK